jgi:hypothetical protein
VIRSYYDEEMPGERPLDIAATAALDAAVAAMGSDVCIWSVSLAIDEIAADLGTDAAERERLWALLRRRFDLAV